MQPQGPPVFLLSCERAGSTLLRYILDTHPEIVSPGELGLGELCASLARVVDRTLAMNAEGNAADRSEVTRVEVRRIVQGIMDEYAAAKGKRVWCDKTPLNLSYLGVLDWVFPDARYICLYRQCLDVVHSCLEASRHGFMLELAPYAQRSPSNHVEAMIESWVEKTERLLAFECAHPGSPRVFYEGLVHQPAVSLAPVFAALGLAWDPALLDRVFSVGHDPGGGDLHIKRTTRIETDRIGMGASLRGAALARVRPELLARMQRLNLELGYPI
jgi:hypothetical protein